MKGAVVSFSFARVCARIDVGDERKNTGANNEPQEHVKTSQSLNLRHVTRLVWYYNGD